jgi:spermidine/putrescine transport system ATP-binding protein
MTSIDVELTNITKRFGNVVAVNDVSFGIRKGEFFSLLGPSGCGKTTIMRMVSGFETPTSGTIRIGGEDMQDRPPFRRPTNLVFQHLALFPHMTVFKNISFGLEMASVSKADARNRVGEMLDLIQLSDYGGRRIDQLSGGQMQRVAIARALVNRPTVLLLDEPLGALDLKLREQMQLELKRIQREIGTTFVYVTHDQKEAITMSNRIAVMNHGVVEQIGDANDIYENPNTAFVANFIGETNLFQGRVGASDARDLTLECEGMSIRATARSQVAAGTPAVISIRPEKLVLGEAAAACENCFDCAIGEVIYQGSQTNYLTHLDSGAVLNVLIQNSERTGGFAEGDRLKIGWQAEKGVIITEGIA